MKLIIMAPVYINRFLFDCQGEMQPESCQNWLSAQADKIIDINEPVCRYQQVSPLGRRPGLADFVDTIVALIIAALFTRQKND